MSERVAIVGSRGFPNLEAVRAYVRSLPHDTIIVSGGARGPDSAAEWEALRLGMPTIVYHAEWMKFGKRAGLVRNKAIVDIADRIVAFWDGKSRGTEHTINLARKAGKPVEIVEAAP